MNMKMIEKIKLKPCPFCGEEVVLTTDYNNETGWWFTIDCLNDECLMSDRNAWSGSCVSTGWRRTEKEAIEAWNHRDVDRDKLLKIADELENLDIYSDCFPPLEYRYR